jgi:hypothetical protein
VEGHDHTRSPDALSNAVPLALWTAVWLGSLAVARFDPANLWDSEPLVSWIAIGVNLIVGAVWMIVHARFLGTVDELQRKIMLDAAAVALGVGLVGGFAFAAAIGAGLVAVDANGALALVTASIGVIYAVASVVGTLRYR